MSDPKGLGWPRGDDPVLYDLYARKLPWKGWPGAKSHDFLTRVAYPFISRNGAAKYDPNISRSAAMLARTLEPAGEEYARVRGIRVCQEAIMVDECTEPGMNLKVVYAYLAWEKRQKVFAAMHKLPPAENPLPCSGGSHYWIAFGGIFICRNCFSLQPIPVITCGYDYLLYSHNGRNKGGRKKEVKHVPATNS